MKIEDVKIGMMVRCYKKTTVYNTPFFKIQAKYGTNPVGKVRMFKEYHTVEIEFNDGMCYFFEADDIGPTIIKDNPQYIINKPLTLQNIVEAFPCYEELRELVRKYPTKTEYTIEELVGNPVWLEWLLKKEFLSEYKKRHICVGQLYRIEGLDNCGIDEDYILAHVGMNQVALVSLRNGNLWRNVHVVKNTQDISEYEWERIAGAYKDGFKLIKKEGI